MLNANAPHAKRSRRFAKRVIDHNAPADQHHTAGNIGKVSQYINRGDAARLIPVNKPAIGCRPTSLANNSIKKPAKRQKQSDRALRKCQGSGANLAIIRDGKYAALNPDIW